MLKGDTYGLALRITNGNIAVRRAIWTVLDEKLLSPAQLKELGDHLERWIQMKKDNDSFIAKLRAQDYLDSI